MKSGTQHKAMNTSAAGPYIHDARHATVGARPSVGRSVTTAIPGMLSAVWPTSGESHRHRPANHPSIAFTPPATSAPSERLSSRPACSVSMAARTADVKKRLGWA